MVNVSVIVPVYNSESKGLAACLESITGQSYMDFELILIDDGSTDNSLSICKEFGKKDKRIKIISKKNGGVSETRNIGLKNASGEFVTFIDSDDFIEKDYLKALMSNSGESDLVVCGLRQHFPDKEKKYDGSIGRFNITDASAFHHLIRSRLVFGPCNKLFKTAIIKNNDIHFPTDTDYGEDRVFCYNYLKHVRSFRVIDTAHYDYVMHGEDTLSGKYRENLFTLEYSQWQELYNLYKHHACLNGATLKDLSVELFWMVNDAIADLNKHGKLTSERIKTIVEIPDLTLARSFKTEMKTNTLIKSLIFNRCVWGLICYYKILDLCKK